MREFHGLVLHENNPKGQAHYFGKHLVSRGIYYLAISHDSYRGQAKYYISLLTKFVHIFVFLS
jgi:hypothetical protein